MSLVSLVIFEIQDYTCTGMNMNIENTREGFVRLWFRLELTRQELLEGGKRLCIRNILKTWFGLAATDDFIWEVCFRMSDVLDDEIPVGGYDLLPSPALFPRKHRELLRAIVSVKLGISMYRVHLNDLDAAYSVAFPQSTPLNVNKKKKH